MLRPIADKIIKEFFDHRTFYFVEYEIPIDIQQSGKLGQVYIIQNGLVDMIELNPGNTTLRTPAKALEVYGPPDEVWIRTMNSSPYNDIYFGLVLYYSEKGS